MGTQWGHSGDTVIAYKERLTLDYKKLETTLGRKEQWMKNGRLSKMLLLV